MSTSENLSTPEPAPKPNESTPVWELVIRDMRERDESGRAKYGTPLQAHNGRKPLVDLYQELLDAVVYTRQEIEERADTDRELARLRDEVAALTAEGSAIHASYLAAMNDLARANERIAEALTLMRQNQHETEEGVLNIIGVLDSALSSPAAPDVGPAKCDDCGCTGEPLVALCAACGDQADDQDRARALEEAARLCLREAAKAGFPRDSDEAIALCSAAAAIRALAAPETVDESETLHAPERVISRTRIQTKPAPETPEEFRHEWEGGATEYGEANGPAPETPEPFCACGRRRSDCDGSRAGCVRPETPEPREDWIERARGKAALATVDALAEQAANAQAEISTLRAQLAQAERERDVAVRTGERHVRKWAEEARDWREKHAEAERKLTTIRSEATELRGYLMALVSTRPDSDCSAPELAWRQMVANTLEELGWARPVDAAALRSQLAASRAALLTAHEWMQTEGHDCEPEDGCQVRDALALSASLGTGDTQEGA